MKIKYPSCGHEIETEPTVLTSIEFICEPCFERLWDVAAKSLPN